MGIDYSQLAIPKPEPRKREKARKDRQWRKDRKVCREAVYTAGGGHCVDCGKWLYLNPKDEGADWFNVANINEIVPRSLGGSAIDPANGNIKCAKCHTGKGYHNHD